MCPARLRLVGSWPVQAVIVVAACAGLLAPFVARRSALQKENNVYLPNEHPPERVGPLAPLLFGEETDEAVCIQRVLRLPLPGTCNVAYCCHLLRLYGWGPIPSPHFACGREVLAALTDVATSERSFGEPAFFPTRSGIRYRPGEHSLRKGAENHRDVCLATFAESGLPLSAEFTTPNGIFHLRDLMHDSVQNFHLQQDELAWTAVAYALYSSPGTHWTNRFGESFGWDELTAALLDAPFARGSCGGTHLLYALTIIRRVERVNCSLGAPVRGRLDERLRAGIASACSRQAGDGGWSTDWWEDAVREPAAHSRRVDESAFDRLLITGHLLECLTFVPPELQPPTEVYRRAARWLCRVLEGDRTNSDKSMCPRTHAICAVRNLLEERDGLAMFRLPNPVGGTDDGRPLLR